MGKRELLLIEVVEEDDEEDEDGGSPVAQEMSPLVAVVFVTTRRGCASNVNMTP